MCGLRSCLSSAFSKFSYSPSAQRIQLCSLLTVHMQRQQARRGAEKLLRCARGQERTSRSDGWHAAHGRLWTLSQTDVGSDSQEREYLVGQASQDSHAQPIQCQVVDKTLVEWVHPNFTTSTPHDVTICCVLMMSTLKEYVPLFARREW